MPVGELMIREVKTKKPIKSSPDPNEQKLVFSDLVTSPVGRGWC